MVEVFSHQSLSQGEIEGSEELFILGFYQIKEARDVLRAVGGKREGGREGGREKEKGGREEGGRRDGGGKEEGWRREGRGREEGGKG